jgi:hypothetical protein
MPWWRIVKGEHSGESAIAGYVQETLIYIINEFIANYMAANVHGAIPEEEHNQSSSDGRSGTSEPLEGQ